jgi:prepilin-type N-terminal cleavage/methylation domain-containing protein
MQHTRHGFSLVELSIVLVILGLLTGGILGGQSLIRAAELRAVSTEYQRYITAISSFRDKYFALPGDITNAQSFWGIAGTCPGTNATPSTTAATCNGDGDGRLSTTATNSNEIFRFWQHLANAGLVEGSYTGVTNSATATEQYAVPGTNVPRSKLNGAGWTPYWVGTQTVASTQWFEGNYDNVFIYGSQVSTNVTQGGILKAEEMWNIDMKLDDGKPGTGIMRPFESGGATGCIDTAANASTSIAAGANYYLQGTAINCVVILKTGF